MINVRAVINDLEQGRIDPELLKIKLKLAKGPEEWAVNNASKRIGMLLGARSGDVIWYFKTPKGLSIKPEEISVLKYKEMLMATVKDALEILGMEAAKRIESEICGIRRNKQLA